MGNLSSGENKCHKGCTHFCKTNDGKESPKTSNCWKACMSGCKRKSNIDKVCTEVDGKIMENEYNEGNTLVDIGWQIPYPIMDTDTPRGNEHVTYYATLDGMVGRLMNSQLIPITFFDLGMIEEKNLLIREPTYYNPYPCGLLSLKFDPSFKSNGRFIITYCSGTDPSKWFAEDQDDNYEEKDVWYLIVEEYSIMLFDDPVEDQKDLQININRADPTSGRVLLSLEIPLDMSVPRPWIGYTSYPMNYIMVTIGEIYSGIVHRNSIAQRHSVTNTRNTISDIQQLISKNHSNVVVNDIHKHYKEPRSSDHNTPSILNNMMLKMYLNRTDSIPKLQSTMGSGVVHEYLPIVPQTCWMALGTKIYCAGLHVPTNIHPEEEPEFMIARITKQGGQTMRTHSSWDASVIDDEGYGRLGRMLIYHNPNNHWGYMDSVYLKNARKLTGLRGSTRVYAITQPYIDNSKTGHGITTSIKYGQMVTFTKKKDWVDSYGQYRVDLKGSQSLEFPITIFRDADYNVFIVDYSISHAKYMVYRLDVWDEFKDGYIKQTAPWVDISWYWNMVAVWNKEKQ